MNHLRALSVKCSVCAYAVHFGSKVDIYAPRSLYRLNYSCKFACFTINFENIVYVCGGVGSLIFKCLPVMN